MSGDFTPGANLEPWQSLVILGFIENVKAQPTNDAKLDAMRRYFANAPAIIEEAKRITSEPA